VTDTSPGIPADEPAPDLPDQEGTDREVIVGGATWGDRFVALLGAPRGPGWIAADELFGPALPRTLAAVGLARGTDDTAVSGTLLFEQYALRLAAPVLAAHQRDDQLLDARMPMVRAQTLNGSLRRLAFARPPQAYRDTSAVMNRLVGGNLDRVADAIHSYTRIGMRVLRGAMANAVTSALLHMSWPNTDRARYVDDALELVESIPGWAGLVNVRAVEAAGEPWMYTDRNTCCQAFRTSVNKARVQPYCATCPVVPRQTTAELFVKATSAYAARQDNR
jgi:ferric iron reductase protein FhuF